MATKLVTRLVFWLTSDVVLLLFLGLGMVGLFYSRALVSICGIGLSGLGLIHQNARGWLGISHVDRLGRPFVLIFVLTVCSGLLISEDLSAGLHRIKLALYYLTLPLGLCMIGPRRSEFWAAALLFYATICVCSTLPLAYEWWSDSEAVAERYNVGKTITTPIIHIRYSLLVVFATIVLWYFTLEWPASIRRWRQLRWWLLLPALVWATVFLHLLAVRTGLLALYAGLSVYACIALLKRWGYVRTGLFAIAMLGCLILAINFVPTLNNKLAYSRHDLKEFFAGRLNHEYSDHIRLMTIHIAWMGLKDHPWQGTGVGDIDLEMANYFQRLYPQVPPDSQFTPICQYAHTLMAFGYIGGGLFFVLLLWPLTDKRLRSDGLLVMIYAATLAAFIGDAHLELQIGKNTILMLIVASSMHAFALED